MNIPEEGVIVKLMPVMTNSSPPPPASNIKPQPTPTLKRIIEANPNYLTLEGNEIFSPDNYTKIYDDQNKNSYQIWEKYLPGPGRRMADTTINNLLTKYVEYSAVGGRSSRKKKINKSSKRSKALKSTKRARTHRNRRQRN